MYIPPNPETIKQHSGVHERPIGFINRSAAVQAMMKKIVENNYGSFEYHNIEHTRDGMEAVRRISAKLYTPEPVIDLTGNLEQMDDYDVQNALTAISGHDSIRLGEDDDELKSALFTATTMEDVAPTLLHDRHRQSVFSAILATKVDMVNDPVTGLTIVQRLDGGSTIVDKVVCDADLAALGKPFGEYFNATALLAKENIRDVHDVFERIDFMMKFFRSNLDILKNHTFHTEAALQLFPYALQNGHTLQQLIETNPNAIRDLAI